MSFPGSRLLYKDQELEIDAADISQCLAYIKETIVPEALRCSGLQKDSIAAIDVVCFNKNSKIKHCVDKLGFSTGSTDNTGTLIVSYGEHIQKALSITEIFKGTPGAAALHQFNRLDKFVKVSPGRNELLDSRLNVPVLLTLFTAQDLKSLPGFTKQA